MASEIYRVNGHWVVTKWSANAVCDTRKPPKIVQSLDSNFPTLRAHLRSAPYADLLSIPDFCSYEVSRYRLINKAAQRGFFEESLKSSERP